MKISNCYQTYVQNNFTLAVDKIDLHKNKINCLIGDNGSGKSTLLKLIIADKCEHNLKSKILMLQKPFIFSGTVRYNIELVRKISNSKVSVNEMLKSLNLEEYQDFQARSLSGGQRQRLAFALVLVSDYDLVMLDEPFNNIDIKSQKIMIDIMEQTKKTFLLVSHKINLAKKIGHYFFLLDGGKLVYEGEKEMFFKNDKVNELVEID